MMSLLEKVTEAEKKADDFGFRWENTDQIFDQIQSECNEIKEELHIQNQEKLQDELGDLIHATLSLCVYCGFSLEETIGKNLAKFNTRLDNVIGNAKKEGYHTLQGQPTEILMKFWNKSKETIH